MKPVLCAAMRFARSGFVDGATSKRHIQSMLRQRCAKRRALFQRDIRYDDGACTGISSLTSEALDAVLIDGIEIREEHDRRAAAVMMRAHEVRARKRSSCRREARAVPPRRSSAHRRADRCTEYPSSIASTPACVRARASAKRRRRIRITGHDVWNERCALCVARPIEDRLKHPGDLPLARCLCHRDPTD